MSEPIKSYTDLIAWKKAFELGISIHRATSSFPDAERFGLIGQLRRSGIEGASSIARGYGAGSTNDYLWFLKAARGEIYKIDTQLLFSLEFQYLSRERYEPIKAQLDEAERVLAGLIRSLAH